MSSSDQPATEMEEPNAAYFKMREELQMSMAKSKTEERNNKLYLLLSSVTCVTSITALIISLVVFASQSAVTPAVCGLSDDSSDGR